MKTYDLVVVGGGLSGVAAAVSAARHGLHVLLAERSGALGGAITNNLVFPFMQFWTKQDGTRRLLSDGLFTEMRSRAAVYGAVPQDGVFKPEHYKFMLDNLVTEAGVDVLFHAPLVAVTTKDKQVTSTAFQVGAERIEVGGRFFCDTTGNGDLFAMAGCDFQLGRESDGLCQPMTTCFRMCGVDIPQFLKDRPMLQQRYRELQAAGTLQNPREDILVFFDIGDGVVHFNTTRVVKHDPTDAFSLSAAEMAARRQVWEMECFLKKHSAAFAHSTLVMVAPEIGVRESRKLRGCHILTEEELKSRVAFEDTIALGNYDIDIHNPAGSGTSHYYFKEGEYYRIPYRSLLPKEYDNLLVAGRCISATHEAQASIRIMPICATLGEAAGTAAAVAHKSGHTAHTVDVKAVQAALRLAGAALE